MRITDCLAIFNREKHRGFRVLLLIALAAIVIWRPGPEASPVSAQGKTKVNQQDGLTYVWIPPGTFMMGCSPGDNVCFAEERPSHQVTITKGFWIGQTEVTVWAYRHFAVTTGRKMPDFPIGDSGWAKYGMPIVNLSWKDAYDYCTWAGGRLPTEAEWEYAARGGNPAARYGTVDQIASYPPNIETTGQVHLVGEKQANGFGLYDMLGNVPEWVNDWYDPNYYKSSPPQDPSGAAGGEARVLRGGSFYLHASEVRVSRRGNSKPGYESTYIVGVRCGGEVFPAH